jgi:tRNA(fMet)-specific endonuclease VapC
MMPAAARLRLIVWLSIPLPAQGQSRAPALVFHGNYRGLGNNVPLPPIDALDAACARHNACTPAGGLPSVSCNLRLHREADRIARDPRMPDDVRALAGLIAAGASLFPFDPRPEAVADVPAPVQRPRGRRTNG